MEKILEINQLQVNFSTKVGSVQAVDKASLSMNRGEVFGLIGESGSGKSVLGLSILQLLPKSAQIQGSITFKGKDLLSLSYSEIRKIRGGQIGLIPQNPASSLNPVLRIGKQVEEAARIHRSLNRSKIRAYSIHLLEQLGFPQAKKNRSAYPFQLSGGMKQRILASIGISGNPELIIADEPTKGLDAITRDKVVELLTKVVRETSAALLLITHDLYVARKLCDRVGVMYAGNLIEIRETKKLFHDPKHPYTRALLDSLPERGMKPVPGMSPSLTDRVRGCKFHPRCKFAESPCVVKSPYSYQLEEEQHGEVRCHIYDR